MTRKGTRRGHLSLHPKTVLISERILACPVFIFVVNVGHLGNPEVTAVTCKASPEVGDKTQNPTTHHKKGELTAKKVADTRQSACCPRSRWHQRIRRSHRRPSRARSFYLSTRALVILDPRPDRDARGPRQWPFHSARPGPKGPARVRRVQPRGATSFFRNPA